jgi:hypothetical protein
VVGFPPERRKEVARYASRSPAHFAKRAKWMRHPAVG